MSHTIDEAIGMPDMRLKVKGTIDYNGLTTFVIKWLLDRKYHVQESKHKHKMSCPHGFKIERNLLAWRKIDDYFQHDIVVRFFFFDAHEVDAVKDGKKVKLWNGRLNLHLGFEVKCDYADRWGKTIFLEKLRRFYDEYIIKKEIIAWHADPLHYEILRLHTDIKKFLEMETPTRFL
jgi:hypothetical protein